jgi:ribosome recycling factor
MEMNVADLKKQSEQRMAKSLETLRNDLGKVRTGRAHAGILDHIQVDYYGSMVPLKQIANVTLSDARTITVQPWEKKLSLVIEKAIRDSDLGLNPISMGEVIRVPMPALTEERRKELAKIVKSEGEHAKVAIRNIRRDANNVLKDALKGKTLPEDDEKRAQDDVQKLTDRFISEVDKAVAEKEKDLMSV